MSLYTTSMMCVDMFELQSQFEIIDKHTDMYHIDMMDGHFVPNIALSFDFIAQLRKRTNKAIDAHLMMTDPLKYLDLLIEMKVDYISLHPDTIEKDITGTIAKLKENQIKFGVVISPRKGFDAIKNYHNEIDKITIMTVEPGFAGQGVIPEAIAKIAEAREYRKAHNLSFLIEVDGSNNYTTFDRYKNNGADIFVLGSTLFKGPDLNQSFLDIKAYIDKVQSKVLGIDIGGTHTRYGIVNSGSELTDVKKIRTADIKDFHDFIINLVQNNPGIDIISIGIPGIVKNNKILSCPNARVLETCNLIERLQDSTKAKVFVNKDVNLLFRYDLKRLNLDNEPNVLGFYLGTGLGNAMKVNGSLKVGSNGLSGELGHFPLPGNQLICGCGKVGCTETMISGRALIRLFETERLSGDFADIFTNHSDHPAVKSFIKMFADMISMEMIILDIQKLIIGGGVANMKDFPQKTVNDLIIASLREPELLETLEIFYVDDAPENGVRGASLIAKEI